MPQALRVSAVSDFNGENDSHHLSTKRPSYHLSLSLRALRGRSGRPFAARDISGSADHVVDTSGVVATMVATAE